jgi:DNA-binding transcriptional regulator YiaG
MAKRKQRPKRRPQATHAEELAALDARACGLRILIKAQRQFSASAVRKHPHRLGLTATQYGKLLGASMQAVFGWEKGRNRPRPDLLLRWAELMDQPDRDALEPLGLQEVLDCHSSGYQVHP